MAKVQGKQFRLRVGGNAVVCEQESSITASSTPTIIRCKTSGDYGEIIGGGTKEGSISFTGAYVTDLDEGQMSAFELWQQLGTVQEAIWGGFEEGDQLVTVPVYITDITVDAPEEGIITFSATLNFAADPVFSTVGPA